jgi:hypothetical protein
MKEGTIHILDLDFEYKYWKNKLLFFRSEIEIFEGRVQVLTLEKESFQLKAEVKTLILVQLNAIKTILNKIRILEEEMALYAEDYPIEPSHSHFVSHTEVRLDMVKVTTRQKYLTDNLLPIFLDNIK